MDMIIAYDIATEDIEDQRRLRSVAKVCEGYGIRVQDSVFECRLSDVGMVNLVIDLEEVIDPDRDSIYIYRITGTLQDARTALGCRRPHEMGTPWHF
ncbi:MAG: CRISPR-associated endonuclease Cas2 [Acidimicrobiales bacterium]